MEPVNPNMQELKQGNIHEYDDYLGYFNNKVAQQD